MNETIIITIVSSVCTLVGVIITVIAGSKKTEWRIQELEKQVEKHNNLIERVYKLEQKVEDLINEC